MGADCDTPPFVPVLHICPGNPITSFVEATTTWSLRWGTKVFDLSHTYTAKPQCDAKCDVHFTSKCGIHNGLLLVDKLLLSYMRILLLIQAFNL